MFFVWVRRYVRVRWKYEQTSIQAYRNACRPTERHTGLQNVLKLK
jgi:hypothetical protein